MYKIVEAIILTLTAPAFCVALAQSPSANINPDRPSNGTLEISIEPVLRPQPLRRSSDPPMDAFWDGLIKIHLKNISASSVHLVHTSLDNEVIVLDSSGEAVPMTDYGKKVLEAQRLGPAYSGPVSTFDVEPGREFVFIQDLAQRFQIQPGEAYIVKLRRSKGLPMRDASGWPLGYRREVSTTLSIPYHWVPLGDR